MSSRAEGGGSTWLHFRGRGVGSGGVVVAALLFSGELSNTTPPKEAGGLEGD